MKKRENTCCRGFGWKGGFWGMTLIVLFCISCGETPPPQPEKKAEVVRRTIIYSEEAGTPERKEVLPESPAVIQAEGAVAENLPAGMPAGPIEEKNITDTGDSEVGKEAEAVEEKKTVEGAGPVAGEAREAGKTGMMPEEKTAAVGSPGKKREQETLPPEAGKVEFPVQEQGSVQVQAPDEKKNGVVKAREDEVVLAYNPEGRIDPFRPLIQEKPQVRKQEENRKLERRVPQTPLEKVDLSQLKLVGIVRSPMGARAMIEESSGRGYVVTMGTYIGLNSGKVTAIEGDRVVVTEIVEDLSGAVREERRELKLQKPTGE